MHFSNNLNLNNTILYSRRPEPDIEKQSEITIKDFQSALDIRKQTLSPIGCSFEGSIKTSQNLSTLVFWRRDNCLKELPSLLPSRSLNRHATLLVRKERYFYTQKTASSLNLRS